MHLTSFEIVAAVKDLYDLYSRINPRGPYRLSLFGETNADERELPEAMRHHGRRLDALIRGAGCLLGNDLPDAALAVTVALWRELRRMEQELAGGALWCEPVYYGFLTHDLAVADGEDSSLVYKLFGEVLAVYLDIISQLQPELRSQYGERINHLRSVVVVQTGDSSSASAAGRE